MGYAVRRYWYLLAFFIVLAGCSTQKHYRTLSFFFDGVPDPGKEHPANPADTLHSSGGNTALATAKENLLADYIHLPYRNKKCSSCHNHNQMGGLNESEPALCYQCHTNIERKYRSLHGPAGGGYCTECHNPHRSKQEYLLTREGNEQCQHCHMTVHQDAYHTPSSENQCLGCHNPHGSNNHSLLRNGACYSCHGYLPSQYRVVHGPVAAGECSLCHLPHSHKTENLLALTGREMCFQCHDMKRIVASETHSGFGEMNCTECHNPHGGDTRFMFN